jgi:hypothetical protein
MQVTLDPPPLGVRGIDDSRPALSEALDPALELHRAARAEQRAAGPRVQPGESGRQGRRHQEKEDLGSDVERQGLAVERLQAGQRRK